MPQDGHLPSHLLRLAQEVRRPGRVRVAATAPARRGEPQTQAVGRRSEPGQGDAAGRAGKKALRPTQRKTLVGHLIDRYRVGVRRACGLLKQSRSGWYYLPKENDDEPLLRRMEEIAAVRVRYGFWRIYVLLRREGWPVNHKRVYRPYCKAGLNLRRKRPRRRKAAAHRLERMQPTEPNQCWSMDFVADALFDGRRFRALTVVDNFTKESLAIEVDQQLKGEDVVAVMERLKHSRGLPQRIQTDNGSEFISLTLDRWPTSTVSRWTIHALANRQITPSSSRSTAASAMSASTRTGSCRSTTPARRSKAGDRITIISGCTPRSVMSARPSLPPDSPPTQRPIFPVSTGPNAGRTSTRRALALRHAGEGQLLAYCPQRRMVTLLLLTEASWALEEVR